VYTVISLSTVHVTGLPCKVLTATLVLLIAIVYSLHNTVSTSRFFSLEICRTRSFGTNHT